MQSIIIYRCPECHALLERSLAHAELLGSLGNRHVYTCGRCFGVINSDLVHSGKLDVLESLPDNGNIVPQELWELSDLLIYLKSQHKTEYVYRGQTQMWPGPLLPSLYRGLVSHQTTELHDESLRLRKVGKQFHEVPSESLRAMDPSFMKSFEFNEFLRHMFGYPMGSILAQQSGLTSEGLDVTHDPFIAAFFAIYDFGTKSFYNEGSGVIYRYWVEEEKSVETDYRIADFYNCSSFVSGYNLLKLLHQCDSWDEALESFMEYGYQMTLPLQKSGIKSRPLHLLSLPKAALLTCRVVQQQAALVFPDLVLPVIYKSLNKKPPPGTAEWKGEMLIEDFSKRSGVECFHFRHTPKSQYLIPRSPQVLFPPTDAITNLIKAFVIALPKFGFMTEFGTISTPDPTLL